MKPLCSLENFPPSPGAEDGLPRLKLQMKEDNKIIVGISL